MSALQSTQSGGSSQGHTGSEEAIICDDIDPFVQNFFVLRHGELQVKLCPEKQLSGAAAEGSPRPWDPPLTERGKLQAWTVGREIGLEGWNITRIITSPFLRCVQTAVEVIAGLCMLPSSSSSVAVSERGNGPPYLSTIKASIECGMAEIIRGKGICYDPSDSAADKASLHPWTLGLPELYSMLPTETHDPSFQPIRQKLPLRGESVADVQSRYTSTFQKIANRYPLENILCVTDGEGVMQSVSMMWPRNEVHRVAHCAYTHCQRAYFEHCDNGPCDLNDDWELLTESGLLSGVFFSASKS